MKIGILETGTPPLGLLERFGRYDAMFQGLIGPGHAYASYDVQAGVLPERAEECDAFVVTGSPAGVYEDLPWIAPLLDFLRSAKGKAKLVGICFGHQAMAQAFGGRVEKAAGGWGIGLHCYQVREQAKWMEPPAASFAIPVSHQDQIVVQPPASRVLAGSAFNRFGLIAYDDGRSISFQCHPEFSPEYAAALIESRRARLVDPDAGLASLAQPNDSALVAAWIRAFLAGGA